MNISDSVVNNIYSFDLFGADFEKLGKFREKASKLSVWTSQHVADHSEYVEVESSSIFR